MTHPITRAEWWAAAGIRALRTLAQTLAALLGTDAVNIIQVSWLEMAGVAATAAALSILTSIGSLPEVPEPTEPGRHEAADA